MARPVKWSRDLYTIRDRAARSRTETWSRGDIEILFGIGRASAQTLMKAIGDVQAVGGTHFVDRSSLLSFLDAMVAAPSVEQAMQARLLEAAPPPRPKPLRVALPADLRHAMLPNLPPNITLEPGRIEVRAETAVTMLESLLALAMILQNDLERCQAAIETAAPTESDDALAGLLQRMRAGTPAIS